MTVVVYKGINKTVNTIAERNALPIKHDHMVVTVLDAIADTSAGKGIATYRWNASTSNWVLISKSTLDTIKFQTEETIISSGQVIASNLPKHGQIWGVSIIDANNIIAEPRSEDFTIVANVITGLGAYNGYKLRFSYACDTTVTAQITNYMEERLVQLTGNAPEELDTMEELATEIAILQAANTQSIGSIEDFEGGLLLELIAGAWYELSFNDLDFNEINPNSPGSLTLTQSLITGLGTGTGQWSFGVLAPNGFIYCTPVISPSILKIDTSNDSTSLIGSIAQTGGGVVKYIGGALASNDKIYFAPQDNNNILVVDTTNDSTYTIGSVGTDSAKWFGAVRAPNDHIYFCPGRAEQVLKVNPVDDSITTFGSLGTGSKYNGGVLAQNGNIYCIPTGAAQVLKINTSNDTTSLIGSSYTGSAKWSGGVLAPNGKIYCAPYFESAILVINTLNDTTYKIGNFGTAQYKWSSGVLGPDGRVYFAAYNATSILVVNPENDTTSLITTGDGNVYKWSGAVLSENGAMYFIPQRAASGILKLSSGVSDFPTWYITSFFNR